MPGTTDVIRGALKLDNLQTGRSYSSLDEFIKAIADMFSVELPTTVTNVVVSSTQPGDEFKQGVWIRVNAAGIFEGVYIFQDGSWARIVPPVFDTEVIFMYGDSRNLPTGYSLADTANTDLPDGVGAKLMTQWLLHSGGTYYTLFHITKDA